MVVPRRCDKAIPISYPLKREPCDFRFGPSRRLAPPRNSVAIGAQRTFIMACRL
jgi:hypothetical protein